MSAYFSHLLSLTRNKATMLVITIGCVKCQNTFMRLCLHASIVNPHVYSRALLGQCSCVLQCAVKHSKTSVHNKDAVTPINNIYGQLLSSEHRHITFIRNYSEKMIDNKHIMSNSIHLYC